MTASSELKILIEDERAIRGVKDAIDFGETGKCNVSLIVDVGAPQVVEIALPKRVVLTGDLRAEVEQIRGVTAVLDNLGSICRRVMKSFFEPFLIT